MIDFYDSTQRKEWVDLGKGISILMVVLFHCEVYTHIVDTGTTDIFSFFRMPFFFFLSGFVFTSNYKEFSLRRKLKQILRGIVWTYFVFTLILLLPKCVVSGKELRAGIEAILLGKAAWFVVSLGVAQLLFGIVLRLTRDLRAIAVFMAASVGIGAVIKTLASGELPFQVDKAFFVVLFFGLGFFYRIYEQRLSRLLKWRYLWLSVGAFAALMAMEERVFGSSTGNVFWAESAQNLPLFMLYATVGVLMMLIIVNKLPVRRMHLICYIGANSLVFYYLNGGVIKLWRAVYHHVESYLMAYSALTFVVLFIVVAATLFLIVLLIRKYCPILVGDKNAFAKLMSRCRRA